MNTKTFFVSLLAVIIFASNFSSPAHAAQTTGGVNWLDPLAYQKPAFYPITVPDEASVANKYFVNQQSGSGTTCSQASPCGWSGLSGKPGMTGGPAYIYLQGNARLNLTGTLYGSLGNEIIVKPWLGNTNVITFSNDGSGSIAGANTISGSGVHHIIFDGGQDMLFSFTGTGSSQNAYTLNISASNVTIARTRIQGGTAQGPALGIATSATGIDTVWWVNNEMFNTPNYYGVYTGGGASCSGGNTSHSNLHFVNNIFRQICGRGIQIEPRTSGTNTYIEGNAFHDGFDGLSCGVSISHAIEPASACGGTINGVYVRNNLAFDLGGGFLQLDGSNIVADNNTIYRYGKTTPITLGSHAFSPAGTSNGGTLRNNIVLSPVQSSVNAFNRTGYTNTNSLCESGCSVNSTAVNVFTSTAQGATYLQPKSSSPAVSAGANLTSAWNTLWSGPSLDYAVSVRVANGSWTIGAFEYGTGTPDTTPPTLPANFNLFATSPSQSSISVSWNPATDDVGVTGYLVERCQGSGCSNFAQVGTPTASPFVDTGLTANTFYNYHVRATDAAGNLSGWSNVVGATTQAPDTTPPTITLTAPTGTLSSGTTSTTLSVTTDKNSTCRYETVAGIAYASMTNTFTTTGALTHSTTISGLTTGTTHRYVRCINGNTGGQPTTTDLDVPITVSAPAAPVITSATTASGTTGTAFSYQITASNNPTSYNATGLPAWASVNTTNGIISGTPTSASTPAVTISATNATGTGTAALVITITTPPAFTLVDFDNPAPTGTSGSNLNGVFQGINFGTNQWAWEGAYGSDTTNHIYFNSATGTSRTFAFSSSQVLESIRVSTGAAGTITISDGVNTNVTQSVTTGSMQTVTTNWTQGSTTITINFTAGWELLVDDIRSHAPSSGSVACNTVTTTNFSDAGYSAYGAPFDPFTSNTPLLNVTCNSADTDTITLTTGITGDTTRIVYTKGYWYDAVTAAWRQYTGTCTGALNGEWCQGSVSATITDANVSTASSTDPTYLVGMTCSVQGGSWKCGCRDTSCTNFSWQIQGAGL